MGIPIMPGPNYNNACPGCFDVDKTPDAVIVSFSGILPGNFWNPTFPDPPNKMVILSHDFGCHYTGSFIAKGVQVTCVWIADTGDVAMNVVGQPIFTGSGDPCDTYFVNDMQLPTLYYYGGHAQIICTRSFSPTSESQHVAGLLNIQLDKHTKFDFWPISETQILIRLARYKKQASIILIYEP